jgi:hypothetical protein
MKLPVMRGVIDRRMLLNYRVDPNVLGRLLPAPFRPKVVNGVGMVGICLIRLQRLRPTFFPSWLGLSSENAAHRTAVEWDQNGAVREGVYIRRRDTNLWLNALGGGRIFPGVHHHARFAVNETPDRFEIAVRSDDDAVRMSVRARLADRLSPSSVFGCTEEASAFFKAGSLGYSATSAPARFEGLELRCRSWRAEPLEVIEASSSVFDDTSLFSKGSIELDCALLMRGIEHEWHGQGDLCCSDSAEA